MTTSHPAYPPIPHHDDGNRSQPQRVRTAALRQRTKEPPPRMIPAPTH